MVAATAEPVFTAQFQDQLAELFRWRRDVRRFRTDPLPEGVLERLLDSAGLAPSVGLSQPWRWVVVDDPGRRAAIRANFEACNSQALGRQAEGRQALYARLKLAGLNEAPCHLAVFVEPDPEQGSGLGRLTMPETIAYSAVIAIHSLWLAARAAGIGLGWVSILDATAVGDVLETPAEWRLVGYLCLGYPEAGDDTPELERAAWEHRRPSALIRR